MKTNSNTFCSSSFTWGKRTSIRLLVVILLLIATLHFSNSTLLAADNPNRNLTAIDIPDPVLFSTLINLADANGDGNLTVGELNAYKGDTTGTLDLRTLNITNVQGLGFAKSVTHINLSGLSLSYIPEKCFLDCTNLSTIIIPDTITEIYDSAFEGCVSLKTIALPSNLISIGAKAFNNCTLLNNVTLPFNTVNLGSNCFSGTGLTSFKIANPKVAMGESIFSSSLSLSDVALPEGITSIPIGTFRGCIALTTIKLPSSITLINDQAFMESGLQKISLLNCTKLETIGESAFSATPITDIIFPESLKVIKRRAFENCSELVEITLPSQITTIEELTFASRITKEIFAYSDDFSKLQRVNFTPTTVNGKKTYLLREIKAQAFQGCINLGDATGDVDFLANLDQLSTIGDKAFYQCSIDIIGLRDQYNQQAYYGINELVLPPNVSQIGVQAFANCATLETINLPDGITTISARAFENDYHLANINLPLNLTTIDTYAFSYCKELGDLQFPTSLVTINDYAFQYCANQKYQLNEEKKYVHTYLGLQNVFLPDSIQSIGIGAFKGCFNLNYVKLPASLEVISDFTFQDCAIQLRSDTNVPIIDSYQGLSQIVLPNKLIRIGKLAFQNNYMLDLDPKNIGTTIVTIDTAAFKNCYSLSKIMVTSALETIGVSAFEGCKSLTELNLVHATNITTIGASAFKGADVHNILRWPATVTKVENNVFELNTNLLSVTFPETVTSIGQNSFKACISLNNVTIPAHTKIVNKTNSSFNWCSRLTSVNITPVPASLMVPERGVLTAPINLFSEITDVQMGDENIATATLTNNTIVINGLVEGITNLQVTGVIEYEIVDANNKVIGVERISSSVNFEINVTAIRCTFVSFEESLKGLPLNGTAQLSAIILPANTTDLIQWSSDNESVVTVDGKGKIAAKSYGTANITLQVGSQPPVVCIVNVCAPGTLTLTDTSLSLVKGKTYTIGNKLTYATAYASIKDSYPEVVTWSSSEPNIVSVDQSGVITGTGYGVATITAKAHASNLIRTCKVVVVPPETNVWLSQTELNLLKGDSGTINIQLDPADSPIENITFTSSPAGIFSHSVKDNVITLTGLRGGSAVLTAKPTFGNGATCIINVSSPLVSLTTNPMTLNKGASRTISITKQPTDTTDTIFFTSRNPEIATVDRATGKVTAVAGGFTIIDIQSTDGKVKTTCEVTVNVPVVSVSLNLSNTALGLEDTLQLIATINPQDAANKDVVWTSDRPDIATVDANGMVTGISQGTAKITVKTSDGGKSAYCLIQVQRLNINGWVKSGSDLYYYVNGIKVKGWYAIEGSLRYFDEGGKLCIGWYQVSGYWRYFDENGILTRGWTYINGYLRFFNEDGIMVTGWQNVGGYWRYFDENGVLANGWVSIDSYLYCFDENGIAATGWQNIGGYWRYFHESGVLANGWVSIDGYLRYFDENGIITIGWKDIGGYWRYFDENGVLATGWMSINGYIRYFTTDGIMLTDGWYVVDGYERYFDANGVIALNQFVGDHYVDENGIKQY